MTIAVIKTGGKQYIVKAGEKLNIEKLPGKENDTKSFETLLVADDATGNVEIGKPVLDKKVWAKITKQFRGKKIRIVKFKSKVRYRKTQGHRQNYTQVEIVKI